MLIFQRRRYSRAAAARDYIGPFTIEARPSPEFKARSRVEHPSIFKSGMRRKEKIDLLEGDPISSLRPFLSLPSPVFWKLKLKLKFPKWNPIQEKEEEEEEERCAKMYVYRR